MQDVHKFHLTYILMACIVFCFCVVQWRGCTEVRYKTNAETKVISGNFAETDRHVSRSIYVTDPKTQGK